MVSPISIHAPPPEAGCFKPVRRSDELPIDSSRLEAIVAAYSNSPHYLVQILHAVQAAYQCIPPAAQVYLADALGFTPAQVQGVVSFYGFFYETPRQYQVLFADNIIEHFQGKAVLMQHLLDRLGVKVGEVRADGRVCVDNTACIGMSDQGPAALVNGLVVTRLTAARIEQMADLIEAQTPLSAWPADWFTVESTIQQRHFLLSTPFEPGSALRVMQQKGADGTLGELAQAAIRGCGGAGFRLDSKWTICRNTPADTRYVVCNADEGEPGTFKDRVLLQEYADLVFEGMTVCAGVIGARQGFLYLRGEYAYLLDALRAKLAQRRAAGLLGTAILGQAGFDFEIEIHLGAGAYICGAETALIESLEGHRGVPRKRPPPFPVNVGYLGKPTVVNNVETLALAAKALVVGSERFIALGTAQSRGTKLLSISGDCSRPGIYEFPYGVSIRTVLEACGADPTTVQLVQNAGPAGLSLSPAEFDRLICYEDVNTTGALMIFNHQRPLIEVTQNFADFFVHESCGFCTPCRVGTSLVSRLVSKIRHGQGSTADLEELRMLSALIKTTSHCGLGMTATNHIQDSLKKFPAVFQTRLHEERPLHPCFDLDAALSEAQQLRTHASSC